MRAEWRVFAVIGGFLIVVTGVYAWLTHAMTGGVERVGTVALALSALLCAMIGGSWYLISRRMPPRPEDRADAEPADGAGDVGFFSPYSYWPILVGLGTATAAFGIAVWQFWLVGVGLVLVVLSAAGLLFEYYTGNTRSSD
ncbi:cytochrome c oxidase subunit 4 [Dactylosporangium matsuzakiense]|uniref:Cytochrome c oxidase polypeptide 4 n=1 Tax=Dactylosporangium matsuzakiense TaxID=53360 RepID=A0A9W6KFH0_9ACTN|nr:cytochrome c oxidase subunit 4 [Dactylosporangium matsuzakiense]UWZ48788.1 cytochrome c oxidase subunit 4 [Dactylosporangium matsuzakiense]GLL01111.1 putative cytochrome c oxidase polypeptide 4 [Dactylosporangium matsuzakiense]